MRATAGLVAILGLACGGPEPAVSEGAPPPAISPTAPAPAPAPTDPEPAPAAGEPPQTKIHLTVAEPVLGRLLPFERERYPEDEVEALFSTVRVLSGPLCRHRHGLEDLDRRRVAEFVQPAHHFLAGPLGDKWSLVSGCWNFVRMNDRRPYRDFELLRGLYPSDTGYACQAVGVMQPYIMSELLGCRTIKMLDFDWQIQAIHWQLLHAWRSGLLAADRIDAGLAELRVDWVAHHDPREGHRVDVGTFCHPSMTDRCRQTLVAFAARTDDPELESITLHLGGLHTLELDAPGPDAPLPVIFLSNATEKHFLTHAEFQQLLASVTAGLAVGSRAILVHHVAADWAFGVYELERTGEGNDLRVRCRDEYVRNKSTSHPEPYETWFEGELRKRAGGRAPAAPPTCQELLRDMRREEAPTEG